jgi:hypothetical protein
MKSISQKARAILSRLIAGLDNPGDAKKLDNAPGAYMALCVECIAPWFYSLAHYGEQNGDAMRDPDIVIWVHPTSGDAYPCSYRNDYAGVDREYVEFEGGIPARVAARAQADLASFCNTWLHNLAAQQGV